MSTILVTGETAAGGTKSLKIQDKPDLDKPWNPHLVYHPLVFAGKVRGSFDIRVEPGVLVYCEWRTGGHPYKVGPRIYIKSDGTLLASDRELVKMPPGEWVHVEITTALGGECDGTFDVAVTLPGEDPVLAEGLSYSHTEFRHLQWLGFVADGNVDGAFYLDNVLLEKVEQ